MFRKGTLHIPHTMLNIGKYKLIGYLLGLISTCYGAYEIYNQFGSGKPKSPSQTSEPSKEMVVEREEINPEEQDKKPINEPIAQEKDPKIEKPKEIEAPKDQPQPERNKTQNLNRGRE